MGNQERLNLIEGRFGELRDASTGVAAAIATELLGECR
jgi:hypothetical protein